MRLKKTAIALAVLMGLQAMPVTPELIQTSIVAHAVESGKCGENITWTFDEETGTIVFEGTGEMTNTNNWAWTPEWYEYRESIKKSSYKIWNNNNRV